MRFTARGIKRAATSLLRSDLLNAIVECSDDFVVALDTDFRFMFFNQAYQSAFHRTFGVNVQIGDSLLDALKHRPEYRTRAAELWSRAFRGEEFTITVTLGDPGPAGRYYEIRFNSIRDAAGRVVGASHIARDVTDRQDLEDRLRRTQFAVDRAADAIYWVHPSGQFLYVNDAACRALGYTREELLAMTVYDIDPLLGTALWEERWHKLREQGSYQFETVHRRKSGEVFPVEITTNYQQHGDSEYLYAFSRDITARKQSEEAIRRANAELARSNAELEKFASIVSHDLRSPMLSISGYVYLLGMELGEHLSADARTAIDSVRCTIEQMNELLKRLLTYSRVGRGGLNITDCDMSAALRVALMNLRAQLEAADVRITQDTLPVVQADETLMVQLLQNLIENAIKYRRAAPPEVHISAHQWPEAWVFAVADNGIGIPREHLERIFGMFQRVETDESKYGGAGIGLATCRKIVEQHGGRIWAESQPRKGSTFHFTLPHSRQQLLDSQVARSPFVMPAGRPEPGPA